jgi:hypothetical protein
VTAFHAHLLRVGIWGLASLLAGALLLVRRRGDPTWRQFGIQCAAWGAVNLVLALAGRSGAPPSAAFLWVNVGLDVGYVGVAVTLILTGRRFGAPGLRGAGWAIVPQGLFLLAADLLYLSERNWI